jgi:hypothetical protein
LEKLQILMPFGIPASLSPFFCPISWSVWLFLLITPTKLPTSEALPDLGRFADFQWRFCALFYYVGVAVTNLHLHPLFSTDFLVYVFQSSFFYFGIVSLGINISFNCFLSFVALDFLVAISFDLGLGLSWLLFHVVRSILVREASLITLRKGSPSLMISFAR